MREGRSQAAQHRDYPKVVAVEMRTLMGHYGAQLRRGESCHGRGRNHNCVRFALNAVRHALGGVDNVNVPFGGWPADQSNRVRVTVGMNTKARDRAREPDSENSDADHRGADERQEYCLRRKSSIACRDLAQEFDA